MSQLALANVQCDGIVTAVPRQVVKNAAFQETFTSEDIDKVAKLTGVYERRTTNADLCTSDLCFAAAKQLLEKIDWQPASVEALIFISQTPDYVLPATACSLHERLGLATSCASFDINLGCSGYVYGYWLASQLISAGSFKRVLLLVGDTCTKFVAPKDRATSLLFGDAGSATALSFRSGAPTSYFVLGTDGKGQRNLMISGGGFRNPSTTATRVRKELADGSQRSDEDLFMDGGEIFNFTLSQVPPLVKSTLEFAQTSADAVDHFVFHQANDYIVKHLTRKLKLPETKVPSSIRNFGNTSSASIPLTICHNLREVTRSAPTTLLLCGFGVGYSWGAALLHWQPLAEVGLIEI